MLKNIRENAETLERTGTLPSIERG
jgi:hypothetical protein